MFQIISDGSCDLSQEQLREAGVEVVPYYVSLDGETYLKEVSELDVHTFFEYCVSHPQVFPRTSMPTLEDYKCAFERALQCGLDVLCYCLTEKFSGSFSCATIAAAMLAEDYPDRKIRVVDSTLATGLQGLLLLELARYAKEGHSFDETYERGEEIKRSAAIYFTIENLSYLSHGGRIGKLMDMALHGMSMRPIIRFGSGELHPVGVSLGRKKSYGGLDSPQHHPGYKTARKEMIEYGTVKQNVDKILGLVGPSVQNMERQQARGKKTEH